jgi:hypothetical protein
VNQPHPEWTPEMQALWDRAMFLTRTRGAYGVGFPQPGTSFAPPTEGTMLHDILFVATASDEEYEAHLEAVRVDMTAWKERVKNARGRLISTSVTRGIDVDKLEISL